MSEQTPIQPKPPRLRPKAKAFVDEYVKTGNGTQAALKAYDIKGKHPEKIASAMATENLNKPSIADAIATHRKTLKQALIDRGIDEDYLAQKVDVLLTAMTPTGDKDFTAIDKGLKHATVIYGVQDPDAPQKNGGNTYNFIFSPEVQSEVQEIEARIKAKLIKNVQPIPPQS